MTGGAAGGAPARIDEIAAALDEARPAPMLAEVGDIAPFGGPDDPIDAPPLPADCPIVPLGMLEQKCWYLDSLGQIIGLEAGQRHGKNSLIALFGQRHGWLFQHFPQWSAPKTDKKTGEVIQPPEIVGFKQDAASLALITECARRGIFDPAGRIRGAGAHHGANGALVLHLGDQIMRAEPTLSGDGVGITYHAPGAWGDHVYPTAPATPRPWPDAVPESVGQDLLALIQSWPWRRRTLDPLLIVGGIGASFIGGALDWRPNIWVTGGRGTGKSTLNGKRMVLDQLFGRGKLASADTTAAGIRQRLRNSTVPVFLDEQEAEEDQRRSKAILELARVASSGADAHRGGADHQAAEFTLQSVFWSSSILIPAMETQDRSRWAVCALNPLRDDAPPPDLKAAKLPETGRKILRRMVNGWARWDDTLAAYRRALGAMGHDARAQDQFGTLLACADLILYDGPPDPVVIAETAKLCDRLALREVSEAMAEHEACLQHIITTMVQSRGSEERESIGTWIGGAVNELLAPNELDNRYHKRLQEIGFKIVAPKPGGGCEIWSAGKPGYIAISNSHQGVLGLYAGKKWQAGVHAQALGRWPGAIEGVTVKFARVSQRATLVPLDAVIDAGDLPVSARWPGMSAGMTEGGAA